jgi:hypothetical protein
MHFCSHLPVPQPPTLQDSIDELLVVLLNLEMFNGAKLELGFPLMMGTTSAVISAFRLA